MVVIGDSDMRMNRRKVLTALGGITIGGGALFGTGAFSQVEAERTVTVNTDGDADALIGLSEGDTSTGVVNVTSDGTFEINFGDAGTGGLNLDATTKVGKISTGTPNTVSTSAFEITNNSDSPVNIEFTINLHDNQGSLSGSGSDYLNLKTDTTTSAGTGSDIGSSDFGDFTTDTLTLASSDTALVVIEVDLDDEDKNSVSTNDPLFDSPATITANN